MHTVDWGDLGKFSTTFNRIRVMPFCSVSHHMCFICDTSEYQWVVTQKEKKIQALFIKKNEQIYEKNEKEKKTAYNERVERGIANRKGNIHPDGIPHQWSNVSKMRIRSHQNGTTTRNKEERTIYRLRIAMQ